MISLIAAVARNRALGKDGQLLWHLPEDMRYFRETTRGKPVIMAGGLGPDNVAEAIEQCKPYGVDSLTKTSIKYDGGYMEKDIDKVRQFCINADAAAAKIGQ